MESELNTWLRRYPVPLMVSAFDPAGDLYQIQGTRPCNHLMGYVDAETGEMRAFWRLLRNEEAPGNALDKEELVQVYADIPFTRTTAAEQEQEFRKFARSVRTGKRLVITWLIIWLAVIPAGVAILEWAGPRWLGVLVLAYSLYKALRQALKLIGIWKPSRHERSAQEKKRRMEEYYDECERNPEGFARLKFENLEREAREQMQNEAQAQSRASRPGSGDSGPAD